LRATLLIAAACSLLASRSSDAQTTQGAIEPANYASRSVGGNLAAKGVKHPPLSAEQVRDIEMIRQLARHRGGQPEALAQIIQLAGPYGDAIGAELLEELAASHLHVGNLNLAAETRLHLTERYPNLPLARRAMLWLVRLYSSGEVVYGRWEESEGSANVRRQLSPRLTAALSKTPTSVEGGPSIRASSDTKGEQLSLYALHLATQAMSADSRLADDPALAFQRAVAARRAGQAKSSEAFLSPLKHRAARDPWGQCARAEQWLLNRESEAAPKPLVPCAAAKVRPRLDGQLNDACWPSGGLPPSQAGDGENAAALPAIHLAYDDQYLYVAIRCQKLAGASYEPDDRPRAHDGNVERYDRVRLLIDVDRDYASWFELVVDSRGWTADRCWGDKAWNPRWFVASGESADGAAWTTEAAIPLIELAASPPVGGAAWAFAATRLAPAEAPLAEVEPSAFSLLLFE
jgi:hypothetical protein